MQPRNYEGERASLLKCGQVYDTSSKSGFTWHPERANVGQRLDLTLLRGCYLKGSDHRPTLSPSRRRKGEEREEAEEGEGRKKEAIRPR